MINSKSVSSRLILKQFALQVGLLLFTVLILFSFQNCSAPMPEDGSASSASLHTAFAYDSQIDTIGYLSSSDISSGSGSSLFTFVAGAVGTGGIKLSDAFITATAGKTAAQRISILQNSIENAEDVHQMAIRNINNNVSLYSPVANYFGILSSSPYADSLAALAGGQRINVMNNQKMIAAINMSSYTETQQLLVRNALANLDPTNPAVLMFTFTQPNNSTNVAAPTVGDVSRAYGRGFSFDFYYGGVSSRVLSAAYEGDLATNTGTGSAFSCPTSMIYKVVRFEDRGSYGLPSRCTLGSTDPNPALQVDVPPTDGSNAEYNQMRAILPANFAIDGVNKCIVSKVPKVSGYPTNWAPSTASYATTPSCSGANCLNFFSVCKRL